MRSPPYESEAYIPTETEMKEVSQFIERLKKKILSFYGERGVSVNVYEVGSTAKGTFVRGEYDVDIYVVTPQYEEAFNLAKQLFPQGKRKYGALLIWHFIENHYDVDLVFSHPTHIKIDTLLHTPFYRRTLTPLMKMEVIKAKAFFKTKGVYGAEIGGITGVAIEELIRRHGTFENLCKYLIQYGEKPFIQDPVTQKPRDLLASITPLRWKQLIEACHQYLKTHEVVYRKFDEATFRRKYQGWFILEFPRRRDRYIDYLTASSVAIHSARLLRSLEEDTSYDYDIFVDHNKILIAINAHPKRLSEVKLRCISKTMPESAIRKFKETHPNTFEMNGKICAYIKRKFIYPLRAYAEEIEKRMKARGY